MREGQTSAQWARSLGTPCLIWLVLFASGAPIIAMLAPIDALALSFGVALVATGIVIFSGIALLGLIDLIKQAARAAKLKAIRRQRAAAAQIPPAGSLAFG